MSYQNDIFTACELASIDNCIMRLVQLAAAIRQNNDELTRQEFDRMERELDCQYFDTEDNA